MEIAVADQRILLFDDQISADDAQKKSWEKKLTSFDAVSKVTSFLSRPKDDDFELIYQEHRYQPFWHVEAKGHLRSFWDARLIVISSLISVLMRQAYLSPGEVSR